MESKALQGGEKEGSRLIYKTRIDSYGASEENADGFGGTW